ncbi:hypothetical protein Salat_2901000 [Sesamum alatum]|uniref:Uncharacterized protein n=1 Tax=Sesamum alatum TaxID=300844 RepID=A0AAE1XIT9_9LAMI|nr:hypothetical protein Salat_2901000 [Sesamum alatum]
MVHYDGVVSPIRVYPSCSQQSEQSNVNLPIPIPNQPNIPPTRPVNRYLSLATYLISPQSQLRSPTPLAIIEVMWSVAQPKSHYLTKLFPNLVSHQRAWYPTQRPLTRLVQSLLNPHYRLVALFFSLKWVLVLVVQCATVLIFPRLVFCRRLMGQAGGGAYRR